MRGTQLRCDSIVELVTDYVGGALTRVGRHHFERHLRACPGCLAYLAQMRSTITLTSACATPSEGKYSAQGG